MEKAIKKVTTAEELREEKKSSKKATKPAKTAWRTDVPELGKQVIVTMESNGQRKTKVSAYLGNGMWAGQMSREKVIAWMPMPDAFAD